MHRYFLYIALLFLVVLLSDVYQALWFTDPVTGQTEFGIGVGTLVLAANVAALALLHARLPLDAPRHRRIPRPALAPSGPEDGPTTARAASTAPTCAGRWTSLILVMFADLYVRMCSMGVWTDWRMV